MNFDLAESFSRKQAIILQSTQAFIGDKATKSWSSDNRRILIKTRARRWSWWAASNEGMEGSTQIDFNRSYPFQSILSGSIFFLTFDVFAF